jgi:hypothetical protein
MLLDIPNAELLKLVAVCKDIPVICQFNDTYLLGETNTGRLLSEGLLTRSGDGRRYRVSNLGYCLLNSSGFACTPDVYRETDEAALVRRTQSSQVMLTLLLAGVDVFAPGVSQLTDERIFVYAGNIRRSQRTGKQNISGNTRFAGLTRNYAFYYVKDPYGRLFYQSESRIIKALLAQAGISLHPVIVYMGDSYQSLCIAVTGRAGKHASYRTAYDGFAVPVHLCPCNPDGAIQMRIMLQQDYRARLIRQLGLEPSDSPDRDGTLRGEPVITGVDMDLRRIKSVCKTMKRVHIFSRRCQTEALIKTIPNDNISFYNIEDQYILSAFAFPSLITEPTIEPYITEEGGYISDQAIRACNEARKKRREKGKADQNESQRENS